MTFGLFGPCALRALEGRTTCNKLKHSRVTCMHMKCSLCFSMMNPHICELNALPERGDCEFAKSWRFPEVSYQKKSGKSRVHHTEILINTQKTTHANKQKSLTAHMFIRPAVAMRSSAAFTAASKLTFFEASAPKPCFHLCIASRSWPSFSGISAGSSSRLRM